jgi:hypothetical protein
MMKKTMRNKVKKKRTQKLKRKMRRGMSNR